MKIINSNVSLSSQTAQSGLRFESTNFTRTSSQQNSSPTITSSPMEQMVAQSNDDYQFESTESVRYQSHSEINKTQDSETPTQMIQENKFLRAVTSLSMQRDAAQITSTPLNGPSIQLTSEVSISVSRYRFVSVNQSQTTVAQGSITTSDGRAIDFEVLLDLQRHDQYQNTESFVIEARAMQDPLVINFDSETATLTDSFFEFDLRPGGDKEKIAILGSGSGYLVLDRNNNGSIDDGSELFGPNTGQGFSELAEFDADGNLWIDENDPIFSSLQVWVQNEQLSGSGESGPRESDSTEPTQQLLGLRELGVGAIYLGATDNDFDLVSSKGMVLGNIKASGVMLMENGEARTVQEIDLANLNQATETQTSSTPARMSEPMVGSGSRNPDNRSINSQANEVRLSSIQQALSRLAEIRADQQRYLSNLQREQETAPNLLEKLLEEMEKVRIEQIEKANIRSAKERLEALYASDLNQD